MGQHCSVNVGIIIIAAVVVVVVVVVVMVVVVVVGVVVVMVVVVEVNRDGEVVRMMVGNGSTKITKQKLDF